MKTLTAYLSLGLCAFTFFIYWLRPDWATALTIFPAWLCLAFCLFTFPALKKKIFILVSSTWICFGFLQVEEWQSMLRLFRPIEEIERSIRITTINSSSSIEALRDSFSERPDIILVQESPNQHNVKKLIKEKKDTNISTDSIRASL